MNAKRRATIHPTLRGSSLRNGSIFESSDDGHEIITVQPMRGMSMSNPVVQYENPYNTIVTEKFVLDESLEGLEGLIDTEHLFVRQSLIVPDTPNPTNLYEVLNSSGERLFFVEETTDFGSNFCGGGQPFTLKVLNRPGNAHYNKEIFNMKGHPSYCQCGGEIVIKKKGKYLGKVEQISDCLAPGPKLSVLDSTGKEILKIHNTQEQSLLDFRRLMPCIFPPNENTSSGSIKLKDFVPLEFELLSPDNHIILGRIGKYSEIFKDDKFDVWGIRFPVDLEVKVKATLIGSLFLLVNS